MHRVLSNVHDEYRGLGEKLQDEDDDKLFRVSIFSHELPPYLLCKMHWLSSGLTETDIT